jgi:hypothetical protein
MLELNPQAGALRVCVVLPLDRGRLGSIVVQDARGHIVGGPWSACGKANPRLGAEHNNPECDWHFPYGDTPSGNYEVTRALAPGSAEAGHVPGAFGALELLPLDGNAAMAETQGRLRLLIHGGGDPTLPTDGSLRVPEDAMAWLVRTTPPQSVAASWHMKVLIVDGEVESEPSPMVAGNPDLQPEGFWARLWYWLSRRRRRRYWDDDVDDDYLWSGSSRSYSSSGPSDSDRAAAMALGDLGFGTVDNSPSAVAADAASVADAAADMTADAMAASETGSSGDSYAA